MSFEMLVPPGRTSPDDPIHEKLDGDATQAGLDTTGVLPRTSSAIQVKQLEPINVTAFGYHG